jgi:hypothetical protein
MPNDIDPEIAALIGGSVEEYKGKGSAPPKKAGPTPPDFQSLFGDMSATGEIREKKEFDVDLSRKKIAIPQKFEEAAPIKLYDDPDYYKKAMNGEGDEAQRLHALLGKYLQAKDPKDKGVFRQQLIPAYWYMAHKLALRAVAREYPPQKQMTLRFGLLMPSLLSPEQKDTFARVVVRKEVDEPIYYVDEWLKAVGLGQITPSSSDEVKSAPRGDEGARANAALQKAQGRRDAAEGIMKAKVEERRSYEAALKERVETICSHDSVPGFVHVPAPYSDQQRKLMGELSEIMRRMVAVDREMAGAMNEFASTGQEVENIQERIAQTGGTAAKADMQTLASEFETIRQMNKLCCGRQGNHFPLLAREYFHGSIRDIGTRENVAKILAQIESIDSEAFCRPHRNQLNRIVPYVILVPSYGDYGICWEPFDRFNRATSRGRVAIPMYAKNLTLALITAIADLRWQVAKEKASYYWMEEGLTGNYYQAFTAKKLKGDVKEYFIADYIVWLTKESEGIQKLDKETRGIFWRFIPFSQEIKEKLKDRSYIYQELYQKDMNRKLSDGY